MVDEHTETLPIIISELEGIRNHLKHIRPEISREVVYYNSPTVKVVYTLQDHMTEINIHVEPRYLKYLGLEVPEWLISLMKKKG